VSEAYTSLRNGIAAAVIAGTLVGVTLYNSIMAIPRRDTAQGAYTSEVPIANYFSRVKKKANKYKSAAINIVFGNDEISDRLR